MAFQFPRNYDGRRHSGWSPFVPDDNGVGYLRPHHPKNHVAFKTEQEENRSSSSVQPENVVAFNDRSRSKNAPDSVDEEAEAFIKHEHSRIQLSRSMSLNPV